MVTGRNWGRMAMLSAGLVGWALAGAALMVGAGFALAMGMRLVL
jgi:hypothetical protein